MRSKREGDVRDGVDGVDGAKMPNKVEAVRLRTD